MKKILSRAGIASYLQLIAMLSAVLALAFYLINTDTDYFRGMGVSGMLAGLSIAAIALTVAEIVLGQFKNRILRFCADVLSVLLPCLYVYLVLYFMNIRMYYIVSIVSFERSDSTLRDLQSAWFSFAFYILSFLISVVASFFSLRRKEKNAAVKA